MSGSRRSREDDRDGSRHKSKKHSRRDRYSDDGSDDELIKKARSMIKEITKDDYFIKAAEFRVWLHEKKNKFLDEISSADARYYFGKFVKAWNRFELDQKYYDGINSSQLSSNESTRYKWNFAKGVDQHELDSIRDHVDTMTNSQKNNSAKGKEATDNRKIRSNVGPSLPSSSRRYGSDDEDEEDRRDRQRSTRKKEAKERRQKQELVLDEVAPKETGREAQLAKKRAQNAYHKRERSPDVELNESDIYGDDRSRFYSLEHLKRLEKVRAEKRAEFQRQKTAPIRDKLESYRAKEDQTLAMFRQMAEEQRKRGGL
ncbi:hypothetical protein NQZ79_g691 [Umbelopsis isabellina]|nr:hypothetical protein NQZ79_g691 [Umbelopsis isabellina]